MPTRIQPETEEEKRSREAIETTQRIASNIASLAKAVSSLLNGPLKKKALVTLLAASSDQSKATVEQVLKAIEDMESDWLNH